MNSIRNYLKLQIQLLYSKRSSKERSASTFCWRHDYSAYLENWGRNNTDKGAGQLWAKLNGGNSEANHLEPKCIMTVSLHPNLISQSVELPHLISRIQPD